MCGFFGDNAVKVLLACLHGKLQVIRAGRAQSLESQPPSAAELEEAFQRNKGVCSQLWKEYPHIAAEVDERTAVHARLAEGVPRFLQAAYGMAHQVRVAFLFGKDTVHPL